MLSVRAAATSGVQALDGVLLAALQELHERLKEARPVVVDAVDDRPPMVLFTDGSFEPEDVVPAQMGGLLIDPIDGSRFVFG